MGALERLEARGRMPRHRRAPSQSRARLLGLASLLLLVAAGSCLSSGCSGPDPEGELCHEACLACSVNDCSELCDGPDGKVGGVCRSARRALLDCLLSASCGEAADPPCPVEELDYLNCAAEE